jgi:hypothetical protein
MTDNTDNKNNPIAQADAKQATKRPALIPARTAKYISGKTIIAASSKSNNS